MEVSKPQERCNYCCPNLPLDQKVLLDPLGHHALAVCPGLGRTRRHDAVKHWLANTLIQAGFQNVQVEPPSFMKGDRKRPADVLVSNLRGRGGISAIDITLISPLSDKWWPHAQRGNLEHLSIKHKEKMAENQRACGVNGWTPVPFVCDIFGALHKSSKDIISVIATKYAAALSVSVSEASTLLFSQLSLITQKQNALAIIIRAEGESGMRRRLKLGP